MELGALEQNVRVGVLVALSVGLKPVDNAHVIGLFAAQVIAEIARVARTVELAIGQSVVAFVRVVAHLKHSIEQDRVKWFDGARRVACPMWCLRFVKYFVG